MLRFHRTVLGALILGVVAPPAFTQSAEAQKPDDVEILRRVFLKKFRSVVPAPVYLPGNLGLTTQPVIDATKPWAVDIALTPPGETDPEKVQGVNGRQVPMLSDIPLIESMFYRSDPTAYDLTAKLPQYVAGEGFHVPGVGAIFSFRAKVPAKRVSERKVPAQDEFKDLWAEVTLEAQRRQEPRRARRTKKVYRFDPEVLRSIEEAAKHVMARYGGRLGVLVPGESVIVSIVVEESLVRDPRAPLKKRLTFRLPAEHLREGMAEEESRKEIRSFHHPR